MEGIGQQLVHNVHGELRMENGWERNGVTVIARGAIQNVFLKVV